jgi:hypothetical protein
MCERARHCAQGRPSAELAALGAVPELLLTLMHHTQATLLPASVTGMPYCRAAIARLYSRTVIPIWDNLTR